MPGERTQRLYGHPEVTLTSNAEPALDHRRGPRRRGEVLENAILAATRDELAEVGYAGLTMERIASRARTSKAVLYRRWSGRAELVVDAFGERGITDVDAPDTGSLRTDLIGLLRQISAKMATPLGGILRGLLTEMTRDPEFSALIRDRMHHVGPATVMGVLERAVERGEVEKWVLGSRRATVATDLLRNEFLLFGAPIDDATIIDIVDDVYLPLVLRPASDR